jgi:hypothetical protein
MKKFFIITLAAALCLALALPAMAKVTAGGRATLDWSYLSQNDEAASGGVSAGSTPSSNGFDNMNFVPPATLNRLNVKYTSDDGALTGMVEFRGGGPDDGGSTVGFLNYAYIQWQITPNNSITFGKQTTNFARFIPNQWVGTHVETILGVGFGNINHTTARTGIKGYWRISDMLGLVWGLYEAGVTFPEPGLAIVTSSVSFLTNPENKLPRVDLALPIRFPWGRIEPSVSFAKAEYDQIPAGDDSYTMWGVSLGGEGSFGMFSFVAELTWGQNLAGGSYRGAEGQGAASGAGAIPVAYALTPGVATIADGECIAWFIDVGFKFGPSKVDLMYGQIDYENDEGPASQPTLYKYTQAFYGISWAIGVAKGFTIRPELTFYDYDKDAQFANSVTGALETENLGKAWLLGIQFMLVF